MKLTKRQKFIAAAGKPTYGGFATKEEVRQVKLWARGHYWDEGEDFEQFCSYSPTGRRYYFAYSMFSWGTKKQFVRWKKEAREAAKMWAAGKYKESMNIYHQLFKNRYNK